MIDTTKNPANPVDSIPTRATRITRQVNRARKRMQSFVILVFVVLGAPIVAIYFSKADQVLLLKLFVIIYFSFLPALIYLQFITVKGKTLYDEYVHNLYRLHIDRYENLPEPGKHTVFYPEYRKEVKRQKDPDDTNMYKKKFEALYGTLPSRKDGTFAIHGETLVPVVIATLIISVSWVLLVEPQSIFKITVVPEAGPAGAGLGVEGQSAGARVPIDTIRFAILGAYFYVLQMLVRRYFQNDLRTSAYLNATMRFIVVIPLVWVIDILLESNTDVQHEHVAALAFIIGIFPTVGWQAIIALVKLPIKSVVPSLKQQYPLSDLDGLNIWYESRLLEEGIEDMQNLATANLVDLMLNTRIPIERLVDWVDQSLLYLHLRTEKEEKAENKKVSRQMFRSIGIRTAMDVHILFESEERSLIARLEKETLGQPDILTVLNKTLQNDPSFFHVKQWKDYHEFIPRPRPAGQDKSVAGTDPVDITFKNNSKENINVFWVDYDGQEVFYGALEPEAEHKQSTFVTHLWRIKLAENDHLIKAIIADSDERVLEITDETIELAEKNPLIRSWVTDLNVPEGESVTEMSSSS